MLKPFASFLKAVVRSACGCRLHDCRQRPVGHARRRCRNTGLVSTGSRSRIGSIDTESRRAASISATRASHMMTRGSRKSMIGAVPASFSRSKRLMRSGGSNAGFVQVVDGTVIRFDDLSGNNLIETHRNILANGHGACAASFRRRGEYAASQYGAPQFSPLLATSPPVIRAYRGGSLTSPLRQGPRLAGAWKSDVIVVNAAEGLCHAVFDGATE
jgi:hypothetical protein